MMKCHGRPNEVVFFCAMCFFVWRATYVIYVTQSIGGGCDFFDVPSLFKMPGSSKKMQGS